MAELKSELLGVLLTRINHYYLPMAEERAGALEVSVVTINKPGASIAEYRYVRSDDKLQAIPIRDSDSDFLRGTSSVRMHSPSFDRLLLDAKSVHYPALMSSWEKCEPAFAAAIQTHLAYAERVSAELKVALNLPPSVAGGINEPYANCERLALFIYGHHLKTHPYHLQIDSNDPCEIRSSSSGDRYVKCANKGDAEKAFASITKITKSTIEAATFRGAFDSLLPELRNLKASVEAAIHAKDLPVKCRYT
ncbi:MAG: hypothetical protein COV48_13640 [Elusimicrobia bacterium CG11_big_fil_rev_8_21_14_0_20_64_6]|nr:MAG: hypothetical protein COV48_13640 [Elusimicrobia bacterium CG11_big_fil_rev_8_21_14_0_20_64_6]